MVLDGLSRKEWLQLELSKVNQMKGIEIQGKADFLARFTQVMSDLEKTGNYLEELIDIEEQNDD